MKPPEKKTFDFLKLIFVSFFFVLYLYMVLSAIGFRFNMRYFMIPAMSLLFIGIGAVMDKIKRNYFIGFRTPWTSQSDEV